MPSKDNSIEIEQVGLGDVLKRYRLRVPANQRDYAWDLPEVTNLLEDVTLAISANEPQHFMGSIVTIRRPNNVLEVTDGQQRLATTALILAAMRGIVGDKHINLTKLIDGFLSSIDTNSLEERPNLSLNIADHSVFNNLIVNGEVGEGFVKNRESHGLLKQAYELARTHLHKVIAPLPQNEKWTAFQRWIEYFQHKTKVILLIVSDEANSFRMFETLNDRGLRVSQSDLIKNYVFGQAGERIDTAQTAWSSMKGTLEALSGDDVMMNFIRHSLMVTEGFLQQKNIYDKIQSTTRGEVASIALITTWESLASDYVALSNPESSVWRQYPSKIRDNIKVLNLFDISPLKPLLLAAAKKMSKNEASLTFEKAVVIGVRLIIASRTTTQSVEKPLGDMAQKIWNGEIRTSKQVVNALASSIPNDQQFREAFETATVSNAQFARYYLRSLERVAKDEQDPWLIPNDDPSEINLEHVCPQKPQDKWPKWSQDDVKAYVKRIGNLVLLTADANSMLKSDAFEKKKPYLSSSPYETTSMVGKKIEWLPVDVAERQKQLSVLSLKAWPLR
jgi:uncharacterized protein with ParB-like and HNH nuclease domain